MASKLDYELKSAQLAARDYKDHLDRMAPAWLAQGIDKILKHPGTPYFFLGMGIEGLTLHIGIVFNLPLSPGIDGIFGLLCWFALLLIYKKRNGNAQPVPN